MTKQLRYRIMFTMMLLLSIIFISIIVVINIWIDTDNQNDADDNLRTLMQNEIKPELSKKDSETDSEESLPPSSDPDKTPPDNKGMAEPDLERHKEIAISHFILAKYSSSQRLISMENTLSDSISEEEIEKYCEEILASGKLHGTIHHLRYSAHKNSDSVVIGFLDYAAAEKSMQSLLMISVILGVVGLLAFGFLSYVLSGLMVRPVEDAFEKQKQFISDASHELKTPITVILSNSELLEDQIGENKQLSYIKKECDQMHHLVTSLLTLTRLEQAPYTDAQKNIFVLSDALLERVLPFESIAFEKGIIMQEEIAPDVAFYGVKEQIQQVATILIDNALTHTPQGGRIDITLQRTPHHILFTVSNTGEAIPESERDKLFERFYRADQARHRADGHYGLGLSIAKTILNHHKGQIRVECKDGVTSFIVTWKASDKGGH